MFCLINTIQGKLQPMKSIKPTIGILLTSLLILSACGGEDSDNGEKTSSESNSSPATTENSSPSVGDLSTEGDSESNAQGRYDLAKYYFSWDLHSQGSQVIRPYAMYLLNPETGEYVDGQPKKNEDREVALANAQQALVELKEQSISDPNPLIDYPLFIESYKKIIVELSKERLFLEKQTVTAINNKIIEQGISIGPEFLYDISNKFAIHEASIRETFSLGQPQQGSRDWKRFVNIGDTYLDTNNHLQFISDEYTAHLGELNTTCKLVDRLEDFNIASITTDTHLTPAPFNALYTDVLKLKCITSSTDTPNYDEQFAAFNTDIYVTEEYGVVASYTKNSFYIVYGFEAYADSGDKPYQEQEEAQPDELNVTAQYSVRVTATTASNDDLECKDAEGTFAINDNSVTGSVLDDWGRDFSISGSHNAVTGDVSGGFAFAGNSVASYTGKITGDFIRGHWEDDSGCSGVWSGAVLK